MNPSRRHAAPKKKAEVPKRNPGGQFLSRRGFFKSVRSAIVPTLLWVCAGSILGAGPQEGVGKAPLPFAVADLQRRADALLKAAESLTPLLEAWNSRRLPDDKFRVYFMERVELLSRMSKDIAEDRNLRQLARTKRKSGRDEGWEKPLPPTSLAEALRMSGEAAAMAAGINEQVLEIAGDVASFEVRVDELATPDPILLCKRVRALADRLAEGVRQGRLSRQP